jgi:hypothetical protein
MAKSREHAEHRRVAALIKDRIDRGCPSTGALHGHDTRERRARRRGDIGEKQLRLGSTETLRTAADQHVTVHRDA